MITTAGNPGRRLLKVKQAADYMSISPWSLRKLVLSQQLRIVKLEDSGSWLLDAKLREIAESKGMPA